MGLRYVVQSLLGRIPSSWKDPRSEESEPERTDDPNKADDDPDQADETIQSIELPGGADWKQAAALVLAEGRVKHEFSLPDDIADPSSPLTIQFGGSSDEPNTVIWTDPPEVTAGADILIQNPAGEVRPIPRTERRRK